MKNTKKRVAVAMSGGVDSSVAAALLKQAGYDVMGLTMKLFDPASGRDRSKTSAGGSSPRAAQDARRVARALGIPHHIVDLRGPFERKVITDFCTRYRLGRTPNPCILCNRTIKFGLLFNAAKRLGADLFATGHYARIEPDSRSGFCLLKKGKDPLKDQSYFLYSLNQGVLARTLFPLGRLTKAAVRKLAKTWGLPVAEKSESQEICFIPDNDYSRFLRRKMPGAFKKGPIIGLDGGRLGEHQGLPAYTVGQRRGLGIAAPSPLYVISLDSAGNAVVAGPAEALLRKSLLATEVRLVSGGRIEEPVRAKVKIRSKHEEAPAVISPAAGGISSVHIDFIKAQRAITPGQAVVFYRRDVVLGGGTIKSVIDEEPGGPRTILA